MYALIETGREGTRQGVCAAVAALVAGGERVRIVFDGPPPGPLDEALPDITIEIIYSGKRKADDLIKNFIVADTAPRRLVVVSSDKEIRRAGRRRRCKVLTSLEFAHLLSKWSNQKPSDSPKEPLQKTQGLSEAERQRWLREFHLDDDGENKP